MRFPSPFRRFLAGLFVVGLLLGIGGSVVHAGQIFSESFEFGPEVAGRAHLQAGDAFELGAVQEGEGEWRVGGKDRGQLHRFLEYIQGGGLRFIQDERHGNSSMFARLPAGIDSKTWEATLEFTPGTLWGREDPGGINGLWLGLVEDSEPLGLLPNIEDKELAVARVQILGDDARARLELSGSPDRLPTRGKPFNIDPEALYRLVLRVDLAGRMLEAVLEDEQGAVLAELSHEAPGVQGFNALQIDMTSLTFNESGIPPVLKKVALKTQ